MEKPEALKELIEELKDDGVIADIESEPGAYAMIKWDDEEVKLTASEARLLFVNDDTVSELLDALNLDDEQAHIEFEGLTFPDSVMEVLTSYFQTIDEV